MTATYWTQKAESGGYEMGRGNVQTDAGEWINTDAVLIHRLAAVAWFGMDAVKGRDIHHRVPIPWLNVESNLVPLPAEEHAHLTAKFNRDGTPESVVEDVTDAFGGEAYE